jgi:hypothetical protein
VYNLVDGSWACFQDTALLRGAPEPSLANASQFSLLVLTLHYDGQPRTQFPGTELIQSYSSTYHLYDI